MFGEQRAQNFVKRTLSMGAGPSYFVLLRVKQRRFYLKYKGFKLKI